MKFKPTYAFIQLINFYLIEVQLSSRTNFEVKRLELCNSTQGVIKFHGNISTENNGQFVSYEFNTPISIDNNIGGIFNIYSKVGVNRFQELFVIKEKSLCRALNTYMGEFWYDLERAAQVPPGVCPINPGKYRVHHAFLDFKRIKLQTFPFGKLRFILKAVDNRDNLAHILCLLFEVENRLN